MDLNITVKMKKPRSEELIRMWMSKFVEEYLQTQSEEIEVEYEWVNKK